MAFKMKGFPMMAGTKPMKMKKEAAMKMKKAAMQMKKEEAAMKLMKERESAMKLMKSPNKKATAKPDFIDIDKDGDTKESMKKASQDMKSAMKMKSPMKKDPVKKSGKLTKDEKGRVTKRTGDAAIDKIVKNEMEANPKMTKAKATQIAKEMLGV